MRVEVVAPGQLTTLVPPRDWSRAEHGVTPGGPFDELAAALANRACGNAAEAPLLECVLVAPSLQFEEKTRVAIFDGELRVEDVERFDGGRLRDFRAWIAIAGGVDPELPRYAEAPRVVKRGEVLRTRRHPESAKRDEGSQDAEQSAISRCFAVSAVQHDSGGGASIALHRGDRHLIRVLRGPHDAPFDDIDCEVTPRLDRVGVRLRPLVALPRSSAELPSIGMQFGSVQQHPDGSLVIMGPDHPVTGGYLQPVTVISSELWKVAQLAPGERVRLAVERHSP
jgi:allophanate hydrolase subunit 2